MVRTWCVSHSGALVRQEGWLGQETGFAKNKQAGVSNEIPRAATPSRRHPNRAPLAPRETRPVASISRGHSSRETRACLFRIGLNDFPLRTDT